MGPSGLYSATRKVKLREYKLQNEQSPFYYHVKWGRTHSHGGWEGANLTLYLKVIQMIRNLVMCKGQTRLRSYRHLSSGLQTRLTQLCSFFCLFDNKDTGRFYQNRPEGIDRAKAWLTQAVFKRTSKQSNVAELVRLAKRALQVALNTSRAWFKKTAVVIKDSRGIALCRVEDYSFA